MTKDNLQGRDIAFGSALESIMANVNKQDEKDPKLNEKEKETKEAMKVKKGSKATDPLKTANPTELSKEGEKDMKLNQLDKMGADVKPHPKEGKIPNDYQDDEKTKIDKLTEQVAEDVKQLAQQAKDAVDNEEYETACELISKLRQIQDTVGSKEDKEPKVVVEPEVEVELEAPEDKPMEEEPMESKKKVNEEMERKIWKDPISGNTYELVINDETGHSEVYADGMKILTSEGGPVKVLNEYLVGDGFINLLDEVGR